MGKTITKELLIAVLKRVGVRITAQTAAKFVPILGSAVAAGISFTAMRMLGNRQVEDCYAVGLMEGSLFGLTLRLQRAIVADSHGLDTDGAEAQLWSGVAAMTGCEVAASSEIVADATPQSLLASLSPASMLQLTASCLEALIAGRTSRIELSLGGDRILLEVSSASEGKLNLRSLDRGQRFQVSVSDFAACFEGYKKSSEGKLLASLSKAQRAIEVYG